MDKQQIKTFQKFLKLHGVLNTFESFYLNYPQNKGVTITSYYRCIPAHSAIKGAFNIHGLPNVGIAAP